MVLDLAFRRRHRSLLGSPEGGGSDGLGDLDRHRDAILPTLSASESSQSWKLEGEKRGRGGGEVSLSYIEQHVAASVMSAFICLLP